MNFNKHLKLEGEHAFLSPSKYHWLNYDEGKLERAFSNFLAAQRGTELHAFASECLRLGIKLPKTKKTLNLYVNDCINYNMTPEQPLYYSENCFGTADAISFHKHFLRIHDLKTGVSIASMQQLEIYAALFSLEYNVNPLEIDIELRLYQHDEVLVHIPLPDDILFIMDKIVTFDREVDKMKIGE